MVDMIRHDILPAVSAFADQLCQRAFHKEAMGAVCKYEASTAREISKLTDALMSACDKLDADLKALPHDIQEAMVACHEIIIPDMSRARELADRLEQLTAGEIWPFPVYSQLLFSV